MKNEKMILPGLLPAGSVEEGIEEQVEKRKGVISDEEQLDECYEAAKKVTPGEKGYDIAQYIIKTYESGGYRIPTSEAESRMQDSCEPERNLDGQHEVNCGRYHEPHGAKDSMCKFPAADSHDSKEKIIAGVVTADEKCSSDDKIPAATIAKRLIASVSFKRFNRVLHYFNGTYYKDLSNDDELDAFIFNTCKEDVLTHGDSSPTQKVRKILRMDDIIQTAESSKHIIAFNDYDYDTYTGNVFPHSPQRMVTSHIPLNYKDAARGCPGYMAYLENLWDYNPEMIARDL